MKTYRVLYEQWPAFGMTICHITSSFCIVRTDYHKPMWRFLKKSTIRNVDIRVAPSRTRLLPEKLEILLYLFKNLTTHTIVLIKMYRIFKIITGAKAGGTYRCQ
uniref:Uncharacterized protein n=1 Tax=Romanomermis culicivorax TaxID=13658 RepID=A0A915JEE8_ROMCU